MSRIQAIKGRLHGHQNCCLRGSYVLCSHKRHLVRHGGGGELLVDELVLSMLFERVHLRDCHVWDYIVDECLADGHVSYYLDGLV